MQNTIAVIFDFDDTLATDSTSAFLKSIGVDVSDFWKYKVQQLIDSDSVAPDKWHPHHQGYSAPHLPMAHQEHLAVRYLSQWLH